MADPLSRHSSSESEVNVPNFKPGDVIRYLPKYGNHCRQATAIVNDESRAFDTFWGLDGRSDNHWLDEGELATAELLFNLSDYRPLGAHWEHKREEWLTYAPADRQRIGSQHQYQSTYFVRVGAEPDLETKIENARERLEEAENEVRAWQQSVEWRKEDLAKLEAKRNG